MADAVNLYQRRDLRFSVDEAARVAEVNPLNLRQWQDREIITGLRKDARLNRWLYDANQVLQLRMMGELLHQAMMDPMPSAPIGKRISDTWHEYYAVCGYDDHMFVLIAYNDGSPIFSFRPLPKTPNPIPAKLARLMGDAEARREIIEGCHIRLPVHYIAMDVHARLLDILREHGEVE